MTKLYFAFGSESEPHSSIWRVWTYGGQVYVSARATGALLKLSLHTPTYWAVALTSESGAVFPQTGSRVGRTWRRPPEFVPGCTQGSEIRVIRTHETSLPPIPHPTKALPAEIVWLRAPAPGERAGVTLLFQSDPEASLPLQAGDEIVGSLPLETGETLWLSARWTPATETEIQAWTAFRDDMLYTPVPGEEVLGFSLWHVGETEDGPIIVEQLLGEENVGPPRRARAAS